MDWFKTLQVRVLSPIKNEKTDQTLKQDNSYLDYSAQELLGLISKENEKKDD